MTRGTEKVEVRGPRWIEYRKVADLPPDPQNPKRHELDGIRGAIRELGYIDPAVLDERTQLLIGGHGRRDALLLMQLEGDDVPDGIVVDADGEWTSPLVRGWASVDDDHALTALVGLNEWTTRGGWEPSLLADVLKRLDASAPQLLGVAGSSKTQLEDLLSRLDAPPSLDQLRDQHGTSKPEDFWPALRFVVPPELKLRYEKVLASCGVTDASTDAERFTMLVERAEAAPVDATAEAS